MIVIGQTYESEKDNRYPSIFDLIDKPIDRKYSVLLYMRKSKIIEASPEIIWDIINPAMNIPDNFRISDGKYEWISDVIYYLDKYDLSLPNEFVEYALNKLKEKEPPIIIGQTREIYKDDGYPSIRDLINQPIAEKQQILDYMKRCEIVAVAPGAPRDIINPDNKLPWLYTMSDDKYGWSSELIYYVEKYDMALPQDFVQYVLEKLRERKKKKIVIGQTREVYRNDQYPPIKALINKPIEKKKRVLEYLRRGKVIANAAATVRDVLNPDIRLNLFLMSDGKYEWRSDVIYYVDKYDMELPNEFIQHALNS